MWNAIIKGIRNRDEDGMKIKDHEVLKSNHFG